MTLGRALTDRDRRRELARLRQKLKEDPGPTLIGDSAVMQRLRAEIARVAPDQSDRARLR